MSARHVRTLTPTSASCGWQSTRAGANQSAQTTKHATQYFGRQTYLITFRRALRHWAENPCVLTTRLPFRCQQFCISDAISSRDQSREKAKVAGISAFENFTSHENTGKVGVSNLVFFRPVNRRCFSPSQSGCFSPSQSVRLYQGDWKSWNSNRKLYGWCSSWKVIC